MGFHIGLGALLLITTTLVHAGAMVLALHGIKITHASRWGDRAALTRVGLISFLVVIMFLASFIESGIWALTYLGLGALSGLEEALYFSMVTFTTLGYGDVTKDLLRRLLAYFGPMRERRADLEQRPDDVEGVLVDGARRAREIGAPILDEVRHAAGFRART